MTTIYLPTGPNEELAITIVHRSYNGIDSDPRVHERAPSLAEAALALHVADRNFSTALRTESTLAFAEDHQTSRNALSPRLAGGTSAPEGGGALNEPGTGFLEGLRGEHRS